MVYEDRKVEVEPEEIEHQSFPISRRGYDQAFVDDFLRSVAAEYREALRMAYEATQAAHHAGSSQRFDDLGSHVAAILAAAASEGDNIKSAAEQEAAAVRQEALDALAAADEVRATAERESAAMFRERQAEAEREARAIREAAAGEVAGATEEARNLLATAERTRAEIQEESAAIRSAAKAEADNLYRQARERAVQVVRQGDERAAAIERTLRMKIDSLLGEARAQYKRIRNVQLSCVRRLEELEVAVRNIRLEVSDEPEIAEELFGSKDRLEPVGTPPAETRAVRTRAPETLAAETLAPETLAPEPLAAEALAPEPGSPGSEDAEIRRVLDDVNQPPPAPRSGTRLGGRRKRRF